jgi:hypothetical protein
VHINCANGKIVTVKKTTLCWLYRDQPTKISADRLRRFINENSNMRVKEIRTDIEECFIMEDINVGEWCFFENGYLGQVTGFQYINGTKREREYSLDYAPVEPPSSVKNPRGINVLCSWYSPESVILRSINFYGIKDNYIDISKYLFHVNAPKIFVGGLYIPESVLSHIKNCQ